MVIIIFLDKKKLCNNNRLKSKNRTIQIMEGKLHKRNTKIKRVKTTRSDTSIQGGRQHTSSNVRQTKLTK